MPVANDAPSDAQPEEKPEAVEGHCPDCGHDDQTAGECKDTKDASYRTLTYGCNEQNPDCNSYCHCKNAFHFIPQPCQTNHFNIPAGKTCDRCGKVIERVLGREVDPPEGQGKTRFLVDHFRAHITALVNLYIEEATDQDPDWLDNLESLPRGALDFALFIDALGGEETTLCPHGRPKTKRCERCVEEGVYTHAQPRA